MYTYKKKYIIENGYNTSHIYSLFIGLFFNCIKEFKNIKIKDNTILYLKELINANILESLMDNKIITSELLNEIRNYSIVCGKSKIKDVLEEQNIIQYYTTILSDFDICKINLNDGTTKMYLEVNSLLDLDDKCKNIMNKPTVLVFLINNSNFFDKLKYAIKIQHLDVYYKLSSFICYDYKDKIYYTVVLNDNKWCFFNEKQIYYKSIGTFNESLNMIKKDCISIQYIIN